jgi:adenylate kinase
MSVVGHEVKDGEDIKNVILEPKAIGNGEEKALNVAKVKPLKIIFLGAPGSGKGTMTEVIRKKYGIRSISVGDALRAVLKEGGEPAQKLKEYMDSGRLVPDEVVIDIVKKEINKETYKQGVVFDGFPRTTAQAEALKKLGVYVDKVVHIVASDEFIVKRMSGRIICEKCGSIFNLNTEMQPKRDGICDHCGSKLVRRSDDDEETIKERLRVYNEQTVPLLEYYKKEGILISVDGSLPFGKFSEEVVRVVEK